MKRQVLTAVFLAAAALMVTGCSHRLKADKDTVYFEKNGEVQSIDTGKLDSDGYSFSDLETYVKESVKDFNGSGEELVRIMDVKDDKKKILVSMKYDSAETYAKFNEVQAFQGTIADALDSGYDFPKELYTVEKGVKGNAGKTEDLTADEDQKVVIIQKSGQVQVDGTITAVSGNDTTVLDKNRADISSPEDGKEPELTFIIYQ